MKAWNYLMLLGYGARDVIITGDSAGGNLALSLVLKLKEQERLFPRGIVLMSPWTDLTGEGKTFQTKAELDPVLDKEYIDRMTRAYAPDRDLTDPYISPLSKFFFETLGLKRTFTEVGIEKKNFAVMAKKACGGDVLLGFKPLRQQDIEQIFEMCL